MTPATSSAPAAGTAPSAPGSGELLAPWIGVPIAVIVLGTSSLALIPLWSGARWIAAAMVSFGLFLLLQTALLRLEFNDDSLLVWRGTSLLRRFPYSEWLSWRLFWSAAPALFYFREQRSIHFLPVLFDPTALERSLVRHLGHLKTRTLTGR
ncbi:MAG: DUF3119 family protein [Cyanobacteriota bacterium]|nr:DUF3119 family protein [Cyanobacteriota bacterium]